MARQEQWWLHHISFYPQINQHQATPGFIYFSFQRGEHGVVTSDDIDIISPRILPFRASSVFVVMD